MKVRGIPGVDGVVVFPDTMTRDEVNQAILELPQVRRHYYKQDLEKLRGEAKAIDAQTAGLDVMNFLVGSMSTENIQRTVNFAGETARGVGVDLLSGRLDPAEALYSIGKGGGIDNRAFTEAVRGEAIDDRNLSAVQKGLADIFGSAPAIAASALYPAGTAAFLGGDAFFKTKEQMDGRDDLASWEKGVRIGMQTASGAMAPALGRYGAQMAGNVLKQAALAGGAGARSKGVQKVAESLAGNVMQQPVEFLANAPDFLEASPEDREEMAVRMLVGNMAFMIPEMIAGGPTYTQAGMKPNEARVVALDSYLKAVDPEAYMETSALVNEVDAPAAPGSFKFKPDFPTGSQEDLALRMGTLLKNVTQDPEFRSEFRKVVEGAYDPDYQAPYYFNENFQLIRNDELVDPAPAVNESLTVEPSESVDPNVKQVGEPSVEEAIVGKAVDPLQEVVIDETADTFSGEVDHDFRGRIDFDGETFTFQSDSGIYYPTDTNQSYYEVLNKYLDYNYLWGLSDKQVADKINISLPGFDLRMSLNSVRSLSKSGTKKFVKRITKNRPKVGSNPLDEVFNGWVKKNSVGLKKQNRDPLARILYTPDGIMAVTDGRMMMYARGYKGETEGGPNIKQLIEANENPKQFDSDFGDIYLNIPETLQVIDRVKVLPESKNAMKIMRIIVNNDETLGINVYSALDEYNFNVNVKPEHAFVSDSMSFGLFNQILKTALEAGASRVKITRSNELLSPYFMKFYGEGNTAHDLHDLRALLMPMGNGVKRDKKEKINAEHLIKPNRFPFYQHAFIGRRENALPTPKPKPKAKRRQSDEALADLPDAGSEVVSESKAKPNPVPTPQGWLWARQGTQNPQPLGPIEIHGFQGKVWKLPELNPIEFPEAVAILDELKVIDYRAVPVLKPFASKGNQPYGMFSYRPGEPTSLLRIMRSLAENPEGALQVFLHELGHAHEWLTQMQMNPELPKFNEFLRLISGLHEGFYDRLPVRPGSDMDGFVVNDQVASELFSWSMSWRPPGNSINNPAYMEYRSRPQELYADFVSGMLVDPATVISVAPEVAQTWLNWLDSKPDFQRAYFKVQEMLRGDKGKGRVERLKVDFKQGREKLREVAALKDKFAMGPKSKFFTRFDSVYYIKGKVKNSAHPDPVGYRNPVRHLDAYQFQDAKVFRLVSELNQRIVEPVLKAGGDVDDIGVYLFYQRVIGDRESYKRYKEVKKSLSDEDVVYFNKAGRLLGIYDERLEIAVDNNDVKAEKRLQKRINELRKGLVTRFGGKYDLDDLRNWAHDAVSKGTRADIWNRAGYNPDTADETLKLWIQQMSPEMAQAMEDGAREFHKMTYDIVSQAHRVGLITDKAMQVIDANKDWYTAFRSVEKINRIYVSPMVQRAVGSIGKIENPLYSTVFKLVPMMSAVAEQRAKISTRDFFRTEYPDEFVKLPHNARPSDYTGKSMKPLTVWEAGRPVEYMVSEGVHIAFEQMNAADIHFGVSMLSQVFRSTLYPLFVTYNPAFALGNPIKDNWRAIQNLPAIAKKYNIASPKGIRRRYLREWVRAWEDARKFYLGKTTADTQAMLDSYAIASPFSGTYTLQGQSTVDSILFAMAGEKPLVFADNKFLQWVKTRFGKDLTNMRMWQIPDSVRGVPVGNLNPFKWVRVLSAVNEVQSKLAAYRALRGQLSKEDLAHVIRDYIGTPNYRRKGPWTGIANVLRPFANVAGQGYASDASLAFNKKSAGAWWLAFAAVHSVPLAMKIAALSGALGEDLEEWAEHVGSYDMSTHFLMPLGMAPGGSTTGQKAGMLRLPMDESSKFVHGSIFLTLKDIVSRWKASAEGQRFKSELVGKLARHAGQAVPSENTIMEIAQAVFAWAANENMPDSFTGRNVFSTDAMKLGKGETAKELISYFVDKAGLRNYMSFLPRAGLDDREVMEMIPGLMRFVKWSDIGQREKMNEEQRIRDGDRAWARAGLPTDVLSLRREFYVLRSKREKYRTKLQQKRYDKLQLFIADIERDIDEIASVIEENPDVMKDKSWKSMVRKIQSAYSQKVPDIKAILSEIAR